MTQQEYGGPEGGHSTQPEGREFQGGFPEVAALELKGASAIKKSKEDIKETDL